MVQEIAYQILWALFVGRPRNGHSQHTFYRDALWFWIWNSWDLKGLMPYGGDSVAGLINLLYEVVMPQTNRSAYNLSAPVYKNLTEAQTPTYHLFPLVSGLFLKAGWKIWRLWNISRDYSIMLIEVRVLTLCMVVFKCYRFYFEIRKVSFPAKAGNDNCKFIIYRKAGY